MLSAAFLTTSRPHPPRVLSALAVVALLTGLLAGCGGNPALSGAHLGERNKDWNRAISQGEIAKGQMPDNPEVYRVLGHAYAELGQHEKARDNLNKAIELAVPGTEVYVGATGLRDRYRGTFYNNGNSLRDQSQYEDAIEAYRTALVYDPTAVQAWINIGASYSKLAEPHFAKAGMESEAAETARAAGDDAALQQHMDMEESARAKGDALLTKSMDAFQKALEMEPDNQIASQGLLANVQGQAQRAFKEKRYEHAIEWNQRLLELQPGDERAMYYIGASYMAGEEYLNAATWFTKSIDALKAADALKEEADLYKILLDRRFRVLVLAKDYPLAEPALEEYLTVASDDCTAMNILASVKSKLEKKQEAAEILKKAKEKGCS